MESRNKDTHPPLFLEFMPVSFFGAVMSLTALCFVWRLADQTWHVGSLIGEVIGCMAMLAFVLLTIACLRAVPFYCSFRTPSPSCRNSPSSSCTAIIGAVHAVLPADFSYNVFRRWTIY
ncbi:MAG TPA: hypothetical protein VL727_19000 [Puia sp.]|nr:hypothetical protein [Puia sp.]